jgi:hypothetical protein
MAAAAYERINCTRKQDGLKKNTYIPGELRH